MIGSGVASKGLHGVKVCIIPRPENNYKPLALRHRALATVSGLLVTAKVMALGMVAITPITAELSTITTDRIVQQTNDERAKAGLDALAVNAQLTEAARLKAEDMLKHDYFAHISPKGVTPWFWMQKAGYTYQMAGENLAIDFIETEDVVAAWMASPSHKENIVQPEYTETGVAALTGDYEGGTSTVVVHMFGRPINEPATKAAPSISPEVEATPAPTSPTPDVPSSPASPRTPRIAVIGSGKTVHSSVQLSISAEPGNTIFVLVNDEVIETVGVPQSGLIEHTIKLSSVPDGDVRIGAYSRNVAGITSKKTEEVALLKDTEGPVLDRADLFFVVSPATDRAEIVFFKPEASYNELVLDAGNGDQKFSGAASQAWTTTLPLSSDEITVTPYDSFGNPGASTAVSLAPTFFTDRDTQTPETQANFSRFARRISLIVAIMIAILLLLAIAIKVRIQHPQMIAHATFVFLLAGIMLMF